MRSAADPERWQRIDSILGAVLEAPREERSDLLARLAGDDEGIAREIESLLAVEAEAAAFLAEPLIPPEPSDGALAGTRLGAYRLLRRLDRGGMGEVYLAVRADDFEQRVAVKVLRRGLEFPEAIQRFENERQILADLAHPRIARLLDGGRTERGLPFLVLEYVEGRPIDRYCEQEDLSPRARVRLFVAVCSAVEELHRHLIVHRDLKPGNVLVTAAGEPKLLDFGIAKPLEPTPSLHAGLTELDRPSPMTLLYASPEQVAGAPLTTASDVYSLGVLLFRILSGRLPYRTEPSSFPDVVRAICDDEPLRLGAALERSARPHERGLIRDLEAILGKALEKKPEARYGSVDTLAADLRLLLDGYPVAARRGGTLYRAAKFVRRRKAITASLAAIVALTAISLDLWQRRVVERERAEGVANFLEQLLREAQPKPGQIPALRNFLDTSRRQLLHPILLQTISPATRADLASTLGQTYRELGYPKEARVMFACAVDTWRTIDDPIARERLPKDLNNLAGINYRLGDYAHAEAGYREALDLWQQVGIPYDQHKAILANLGTITTSLGHFDEAERWYRKLLALGERLHGPDSPEAAQGHARLGNVAFNRGDLQTAEARLRKAIEIYRRQTEPDTVELQQAELYLGRTLLAARRTTEAETLLESLLAARHADYPDSTRLEIAEVEIEIGLAQTRDGRAATAEPLLRQALTNLRARVPENRFRLANAESVYGECLLALGRRAEAEPLLRGSLSTLAEVRGKASIYTREAQVRVEALERSRPG
ncbi:MAG TPA: protein kinase [Thermoanaerobaculia bacterium]|nr:protein kinase [Thermoanaerobaculia bacterium]